MTYRLSQVAIELRGNLLLLPCLGGADASHPHCGGWIRVPFDNPTHGERLEASHHWHRDGETVETLTLTPSIDAGACGHVTITNGDVHGAA